MADYRSTDPGVEQIILHAQEFNQDRRRASRRKLRRETMTMMMGTASLALAIVVVIVTLMGLFGMSFAPWSEPREFLVNTTATGFIDRWISVSDSEVRESALVSSGRIWAPSCECDWVAWLGLVLGGLGLAVSLRRQELSWSSAIGFIVILLMLVTVATLGTLMRLWPEPRAPIRPGRSPGVQPAALSRPIRRAASY